jgi:hypothetical protein
MATRTLDEVSCALRARREKGQFNTLGESGRVAGERVETFIVYSLLQCVVLSPSQCLNLKALMRTLDKTGVSSIQGVRGGETLVFFLTKPGCGTRGAVR